jgi:dipeptidase
VFHAFAPSRQLSAEYTIYGVDSPYPASLQPDFKVTVSDLMRVMRSSYEGTPYDLTVGLAAGPYGTPDRWGRGQGEAVVAGSWERPIATWRSGCSLVAQARAWLPSPVGGVVWYAPQAAHMSVYVPFAVGMTDLPQQYSNTSSPRRSSALLAHRALHTVAQLRYNQLIGEIKQMQDDLESSGLVLQSKVDHSFLTNGDVRAVTDTYIRHAANATEVVWAKIDDLFDRSAYGLQAGIHGYPAWWLQAVGYANGPPPAIPTPPPNQDAKHMLQISNGLSIPKTRPSALRQCLDSCEDGYDLSKCARACLAKWTD